MKNSSGFMYTIIHVLAIVAIACCQDDSSTNDIMDTEEIVDPHSFYYDRQKKMMIKETDLEMSENAELQSNESEKPFKSITTTDNYNTHEGIFYKRLVNLLLSNIDIKAKDDDIIIGTISMEVSRSQMEILQNFHLGKTSLREIDSILSDVIKKPKYNYLAEVMYSFDALLKTLNTALRMIQENRDAIIIVFVILTTLLLIKKIKWGRGLPIFVIIQILVVISFFMTWWQLIQEAEIKLTATQMQFSEIPIACQPHKMNLWHKFVFSVFSNDDCEKYYEAVMSNPKLQVTPALALSHFLSTVILHPITNVGTVISSFIENATGSLPWTYGWIVKLILFLSIGLTIIVLALCLCGASINMGLGPLFKFGINFQKKSKTGNPLPDTEKREPIQIILQLPQGTDTKAIAKVSKTSESKVVQAITNTDSERKDFDESDDFQDSDEDLSGGDTIANTKSSRTDKKKKKVRSLMNTNKGDGCGDG